jgi:hypothetical protein
MAKIIKKSFGNFLVIFVIFSLVTGWMFSGWPRIWQKPQIPPEIQEAQAADTIVYIINTASTTWTVPANWSASNTIEAIGAGGNGGYASATVSVGVSSGGGGGGGEYRKAANVTLTADSAVDIHIASAGDGSSASGTWVKNGAGGGGSIVAEAKHGGNATWNTAGGGGTGQKGDHPAYQVDCRPPANGHSQKRQAHATTLDTRP